MLFFNLLSELENNIVSRQGKEREYQIIFVIL